MRSAAAACLAILAWLAACAGSAPVKPVALTGAITQGGTVFGTAEPSAAVTLDGRPVRVAPDGRFVFGFGRDAPATAMLEVRHASGIVSRIPLEVARRDYDIQHVDGLPQNLVTPDPEEEARIAAEQAKVLQARTLDLNRALFASGFAWPAIGPVSGVYGSQRILNGEPRAPHYGVDVAAPEGAPVHAPADGLVTFAAPDLLLTGGTVVIDHGHGLSSTFIHLSRIDVAPGAEVKQGDVLGAVGATGRATGPHLHWGMNWFEVRLDPQLVVGPMPDPATQ
ncbi:MAG TPA: M23 family metallopeptidase [Methylomirabilota bacterium]|jgi:peptidase M23-like protein|nr:M23 family metallopeptidase [Methylomirabilota bacterium]